MNTLVLVHESADFVAVDKPAAWLSVPSRMGEEDARPCVGIRLQEQLGRQVWPVHRLDAEVTGLLLFALNAEAHRKASKLFEGREAKKTYHALSESKDPAAVPARGGEALRWESNLLRGKKRAFESPAGKPSVTLARLLGPERGTENPALCWELEPLTGRSHQLRYEMTKHGFPILGDTLYGATRAWPDEGIALRAVKLVFPAGSGMPEGLKVKGLF